MEKNDQNTCKSITTIQAILGGKWNILILWHLSKKELRFGELYKALPGISQSSLTKQLRVLEQNKIINRQVFSEVPPRVVYSLTPLGKEFIPLLEAMGDLIS